MNDDKNKPTITITGGVQGGNINMGGTQDFRGNVTFSMGAVHAGDDTRQQLAELVKQLADALTQLPAEQKDDAEVVQSLAQEAIDEVSKEKPNRRLLEIKGENLKKAAENLLAVAPIAAKIAKTLLTIG